MIRACLDTNVVISALILDGPANRLAFLWQKHKFRWCVSKEVLSEYLRVLAYPKFELSAEEVKSLTSLEILPYLSPVKVSKVMPVIRQDPSDDVFLACAKSGKCDYLVSGDKHLLALESYERIKIIPLASFLRLFE